MLRCPDDLPSASPTHHHLRPTPTYHLQLMAYIDAFQQDQGIEWKELILVPDEEAGLTFELGNGGIWE